MRAWPRALVGLALAAGLALAGCDAMPGKPRLADREKLPTDTAYAMSRVESEAERMSHLVEDMLLLARLDSGPALDLKPCDLSEIVINAVSDARAAGPCRRAGPFRRACPSRGQLARRGGLRG